MEFLFVLFVCLIFDTDLLWRRSSLIMLIVLYIISHSSYNVQYLTYITGVLSVYPEAIAKGSQHVVTVPSKTFNFIYFTTLTHGYK